MHDVEYQIRFQALADSIRMRFSSHPGCHDWDHTERVLHNARCLATLEGADMQVVEVAAVLHDVGRLTELQDQGRTCHAELGGRLVGQILPEAGFDDLQFIDQVQHCVATHRYRRRTGQVPQSLEAKVVFDADKLDSIGAVGIGRAFHFAGRTGARLHNTEDEAISSDSYSREDTAYREFLVKLRHLQGIMLTASGRQIASQRHRFMLAFFEQLNSEVNECVSAPHHEWSDAGQG